MPVTLVAMPWQAVDSPSLPIGILRAVAATHGFPVPVAYAANLRWVEFLMARSNGELGPVEYHDIAENGLFHGLGDWVFTGVLHSDPDFGVAALQTYAAARELPLALARRMRELAADFVEVAVQEILETAPTVVGFSTTFMQNVPSLAAAKRLKELAPEVSVVFGGGNCDGPMGAAIHRNYAFVDYVISGEAERAFPALLRALDGAGSLTGVRGLCWRDDEGVQHRNPTGGAVPVGDLPVPDFGDYFERLGSSPAYPQVEPRLVMETARGCWWGEKHHCTFCGLNGSLMNFRAKAPDAAVTELSTLAQRHRVLDVIVVDNIIDTGYFSTVLPQLAALDWDLRIHYEVKANLRPQHIAALREAGVVQVQPGIESLVDAALALMDKGVSAVHNVRTLRDCEEAGLTVSWNWLYGFPGESNAAYTPVFDQLPSLVHLQPPLGAGRILVERFSPYFDNPHLGFAERATANSYRHVYNLPETELQDMVYLFDAPPRGITIEQAQPLHDLIERWTAAYPASSLRYLDDGTQIVIHDRRVGWPERDHRIDEPRWRSAYLELAAGHTTEGLRRKLAAGGVRVESGELHAWLAELRRHGLVFEGSDRFVTLAVGSEPVKLEVSG